MVRTILIEKLEFARELIDKAVLLSYDAAEHCDTCGLDVTEACDTAYNYLTNILIDLEVEDAR